MYTIYPDISSIGSKQLRSVSLLNPDPADDSAISYTVTTLPTRGSLQLNGPYTLGLGSVFTQQNLDYQSLSYVPSSSGSGDSFGFSVSDGVSTLTGQTFTIVDRHENTLPTDAGILCGQGSSCSLAGSLAQSSPDGDLPAQELYTLDTMPQHGWIELAGTPLVAGQIFTQGDIDAGRVSYRNDGGVAASDSFYFQYGDAYYNTLGAGNITIIGPPVLAADSGIAYAGGPTPATITSGELQVTDVGIGDGSLVYTLVAAPSGGTLAGNGLALADESTFTQLDIDNGLLTYADGTGSSTSFTVSVVNGLGGSIPSATFPITITALTVPTITWTVPSSPQIYGATGLTVSAASSSSDAVAIAVQSGPASLAAGNLTLTGAGTVVLSATDPGNALNGFSPTTVSTTLMVQPAPLTLSADNLSRLYGGQNPPLTYTLNGFIGTDTQSNAMTGAPQLYCTSFPSWPAGNTLTITINAGSLESAKYRVATIHNGTLSVNPAPLTVAAIGATGPMAHRTHPSASPTADLSITRA